MQNNLEIILKQPLPFLLFMVLALRCVGQTPTPAIIAASMDTVKHHNKLDDIHSAAEIEALLTSIHRDYDNFRVNASLVFKERKWDTTDNECQRVADSLHVQAWTKCDVDGNGYTDLLVVGTWYDHSILCLMDSGNARITVKHITRRSFQEITFPVVSQVNGKPAILYYAREERKWINDGAKRKWLVDTLVYMFGDFVEYNMAPAHHAIGSISYRTGHCFGKCPVFDLKIKSDRSAILEAREFNDRAGVFTATIDPSHFDQLVEILNYIDVAALDSAYSVPWTDAQSCVLTVTFEDGRTKEIRDYGLLGTYGLQRTYRLLFNLRKNQVWK